MKRTMKLTTLLLALVMIVGILPISAMAAEGDFVITITNDDPNSSADHTYEAYQIFAGDLKVNEDGSTTLSNIVWGDHVDGAALLAALKAETHFGVGEANLFSSCTNAAEVAEVISVPSFEQNNNLATFAKVAESCLNDTAPYSSTEATAPYTITIPSTEPGYYLVKDMDGSLDGIENRDYTRYILKVVKSTSVEHKGSVPTLDKTVSTSESSGYSERITTAMAKTYYYKLTASLPSDYADYEWYYLALHDTMSPGITFQRIESIVISSNNGRDITVLYDADDPATHNQPYFSVPTATTEITTGEQSGWSTFTVACEDLKANFGTEENPVYLKLLNTNQIIVTYSAMLNENAIIGSTGNPNDADLEFSNNPGDENDKGKTPPDESRVYTFELNVIKQDGETQVKLSGAKFVLFREYHVGVGADAVEHTEYAFVDENGKVIAWAPYLNAEAVPEGTEDALVASVLESDANGNFKVSGLNAGTYYLREVESPDGYNLLLEDVVVTITASIDNESEAVVSMTCDTNAKGGYELDAANGRVIIKVHNRKGSSLPETGGMGTTLFYVFGGLMVCAATVLLITKKRMAAN